MAGATLIHDNLTWLGPIEFTDEEQEFARQIQRATGVEPVGLKGEPKPLDLDPRGIEGGSTDVADVSWKVPTLHLSVTTAALDAPWHAWPVVATGGMSIGHKGMVYAAKTLAATMVDLYDDPAKLAEVRARVRGEDPRRRVHELSAGRTTAASGGLTPRLDSRRGATFFSSPCCYTATDRARRGPERVRRKMP